MLSHIGAIDLGGTHVRAALVSSDGKILWRTRHRTPKTADRPDFLVEMAAAVVERAPNPLDRLVVGIPGIIDYQQQMLVEAPNLPQAWIPYLRSSWLAEQTGLAVSLANDADLAAVGETYFGAGIGTDRSAPQQPAQDPAQDVVYVTISTGVGGGVVLGRKLLPGRFSGAEIGHTIVDIGRLGEEATVEGIGAGPAIAKASAQANIGQRENEFMNLVRQGDAEAGLIWHRAISAVSVGIVNLAWVLSPEMVVVGGGVGMNADLVLPTIRTALADYGPRLEIQVVSAKLGDDAALAGAASWFEALGR